MEQKTDFKAAREKREMLELDICKLATDIWLFKQSIIRGDTDAEGTTVNVENAVNKLQLLQKKILFYLRMLM